MKAFFRLFASQPQTAPKAPVPLTGAVLKHVSGGKKEGDPAPRGGW